MVRPDDVILHHANGAVRAVSRALQPAVPAPHPESLPAESRAAEGWLLRVSMQELAEPIGLKEIPLALRLHGAQPTFTVQGSVSEKYLTPVGLEWFAHFSQLFADRLAGTAALQPDTPTEVREGAETLLRSLLGQELKTLTGATNIITAVSGDTAMVATTRSPAGQPVPIAIVQAALDTLRSEGTVICQPPEASYRSAFIGAVLSTLPGTIIGLNPARVSLASHATSTSTPSGQQDVVAPPGDLDVPVTRYARTEQAPLRRSLVANRSVAPCALCGQEMPVELLVAAHIKQRSLCEDEEKRDLLNIGMLACKLGCDDFYELGYISVDLDGTIITVTPDDAVHGLLVAKHLASLAGKPCLAFTAANAHYFEWHRTNKYPRRTSK